jgi:hypothetical protein
MSKENPLWGASRIHGEFLMLGFEVAQSTVSKYLVCGGAPPSQTWKTFFAEQRAGDRRYRYVRWPAATVVVRGDTASDVRVAAATNARSRADAVPGYVDVIIERWQLYTGKAALFDTTDETFEEITERRKTQSGETAASSDDAAASKGVVPS